MNGTPILVRALAISVAVAAVVGIAWSLLTPTVHGELTEDGRVSISPTEIPAAFSGVAVFALMMLVYGGVIAVVLWRLARTSRGLIGLTAAVGMGVLGTAIAGFVGSLFVGIRTSTSGATVGDPVQVVGSLWLVGPTRGGFSSPWALVICAPAAAALMYLICTILAKDGDLGVGDGGRMQEVDATALPHQPLGYSQGAYAPGYYPPTRQFPPQQFPPPPTAGGEGSQTRP